MNSIEDAVWLIIDPWGTHPEQKKNKYNLEYINNINDYFGHKIYEYTKDIKYKYTVIDYHIRKTYKVHNKLKNYPAISHKEAPNIIGRFPAVVYTGFHHGRCILHRDYSGARFISENYKNTKIFFKRDLICLLPGDDWLVMDKNSKIYGELI